MIDDYADLETDIINNSSTYIISELKSYLGQNYLNIKDLQKYYRIIAKSSIMEKILNVIEQNNSELKITNFDTPYLVEFHEHLLTNFKSILGIAKK